MEHEIVKTIAKPLKELLPEVYGDALKPSMRAVGNALGGTLEMVLLPMAALGYIPKIAKTCLDKHLHSLEEKINKIPIEKRIEIHPQISTPVIQKLLYTTNDTIAELFINLLTNSAHIDMSSNAHPGFIDIISQLSPDEAKIIQYLKGMEYIPYAEIRAYVKDGEGFATLLNKSTLTPFDIQLDFEDNIQAYYTNLIRLGILEDKSGLYKTNLESYDKIAARYNFAEYEKLVPEQYKNIEIKKSFYEVTPLGKLFIAACCSTD